MMDWTKQLKKNKKLTSYGFKPVICQRLKSQRQEFEKMVSINETAKHTENAFITIDMLEKIDANLDVFEGEATKKDGEKFTYNFIKVDGKEIRIPKSVLLELKAQNEVRKTPIKFFKVVKKGEGLNTSYSVVILE